jgi:hypothetical protein
VILFGLVNNVAAEVDAVTASEASAQKTTGRISLRTTGKRVILPIHIALETVSLIRGLLSPVRSLLSARLW